MTPAANAAPCLHHAAQALGEPLINGVRLDPLSPSELPTAIEPLLTCGRSHVVHFLPGHPMVLARRDPEYRAVLNKGELNLVDGASVVLALRLWGVRAPRTTGTTGLLTLAAWGVAPAVRHYLFGGSPEVVERLQRTLTLLFPGIAIVGTESPPFHQLTADYLAAACDRIQSVNAQLVWLGLGSPKQDRVAERLRELDAAPVLLCVGAAFDFVAGTKRRAPEWMQRAGLEWMYRLFSEPRRLWRRYLVDGPVFVTDAMFDRLQRGQRGKSGHQP